jgi:hypothetical protein
MPSQVRGVDLCLTFARARSSGASTSNSTRHRTFHEHHPRAQRLQDRSRACVAGQPCYSPNTSRAGSLPLRQLRTRPRPRGACLMAPGEAPEHHATPAACRRRRRTRGCRRQAGYAGPEGGRHALGAWSGAWTSRIAGSRRTQAAMSRRRSRNHGDTFHWRGAGAGQGGVQQRAPFQSASSLRRRSAADPRPDQRLQPVAQDRPAANRPVPYPAFPMTPYDDMPCRTHAPDRGFGRTVTRLSVTAATCAASTAWPST